MTDSETKPIWLRLDPKNKARIQRIADRDDRSVAFILKQAALEYATRREAAHRRAG